MVSTFWSTGGWLADLTFSCEGGGVMTGTCYCRKWTSKHKGEVPSTLLTDTPPPHKQTSHLTKLRRMMNSVSGKLCPLSFSSVTADLCFPNTVGIYLHSYRLYLSIAEYHWQYHPAGAHIPT